MCFKGIINLLVHHGGWRAAKNREPSAVHFRLVPGHGQALHPTTTTNHPMIRGDIQLV